MAVEHMVMYKDVLFEELKEDIRMTYGVLEYVEGDAEGRYSYKTYCEYIMKNGKWCEPIMLKAIASMWGCKITIIHADNFYQTKIRHQGDTYNADIVMVFNASYLHAHYITCIRTNGENFIVGIQKEDEEYDWSLDRVERAKRKNFDWEEEGEHDLMVIPMDVYKMLVYKSEEYDKMM